MLRASLLIYLDTSPIFNCVRKLSVRYVGCWNRDVCWSGILCFSVTVTDSMLEPSSVTQLCEAGLIPIVLAVYIFQHFWKTPATFLSFY